MALKNKTHDIDKASIVQRVPQQEVALDSNKHERPLNPTHALKRAASAPPAALRPADILALQRTVGNRAVHRMLTGQTQRAQASESQGRQPIQTRLTIGAANDKYEQEADRVAHQVMSMDARPASQSIQRESKKEEEDLQRKPSVISITPLVQREVKPEDEELRKSSIQRQIVSEPTSAVPGIENAIQHARGSGQALPQELRARMEPAFGADFSGVRVHTDAESDRLNQSLHSRAFTTGHDLFFKRGEYTPGSRAGQELIAHELTHVVQQITGTSRIQRVILKGDLRERDTKTGAFDAKDLPMLNREEKFGHYTDEEREEIAELLYELKKAGKKKKDKKDMEDEEYVPSQEELAEAAKADKEDDHEFSFADLARTYAGRTIEQIVGNLPYRFSYDKDGFVDFDTPKLLGQPIYKKRDVNIADGSKVKHTGKSQPLKQPKNRNYWHFKAANIEAGEGKTGTSPSKDLTWHHHKDEGRMQLVNRAVHEKFAHIGGKSRWGTG